MVRGLALRRGATQAALRHDPVRAAALSGFDALALRVPTPADVTEWAETLDEPHGGVVTGHAGGRVLVGLHDPDGIEIRLYADPPALPVTWTDRGCGDLVLLVHAGVFGAWFDPLADALTGYRVVTVRRAGYTDGPAPAGPVEIAEHAAHLAQLLEHLDAGTATVVGHSSGSAVVMQAWPGPWAGPPSSSPTRCRRWRGGPAPVLLVQGGGSPPATHHMIARLADMLPEAQIATIEGDDHLLPRRSPDALARLVETFATISLQERGSAAMGAT